MTRSMQPTIHAVDRLSQAKLTTERLATSYQRGREDGIREGRQAAYRRVGYIATALIAVCVVGAWVIG